jgi:uncharacterized protein (DUF1697 family)
MNKYVVLLRGINVGGHNKIRMVDLRKLCKSIGFRDVKSYIQSGNLVVTSDFSPLEASSKLKNAIKKSFDMEPNVHAIDANRFMSISKAYPFEVPDHKEAHTMFLAEKPSKEAIKNFEALDFGPDKMKLTPQALYMYLPNGVSGSKMNFKSIEKTLGVSGTARNRRTIEKLNKMIVSPKS